MGTHHWKTKILNSHITALNRQVTETTIISNEGLGSLLNSKNEFGANNLPELVLLHGTRVEGATKRRRQANANESEQPATNIKKQPSSKRRKFAHSEEPDDSSGSLILQTSKEELPTDTEGVELESGNHQP